MLVLFGLIRNLFRPRSEVAPAFKDERQLEFDFRPHPYSGTCGCGTCDDERRKQYLRIVKKNR